MQGLVNNFSILLFAFLTSISHSGVHTLPNPPIPSVIPGHGKMITATGSISEYGNTVTLDMTFPENGGALTGTISGNCHGSIHGAYTGGKTGQVVGSVQATCPVLFATFDGVGTFNGPVNVDNPTVSLNATVSSKGLSTTQTVTLTLSK